MSSEEDEKDTEEEHRESGHYALSLLVFACLCCLSRVCLVIIILKTSINIYYICDKIEHIYSNNIKNDRERYINN